MLIIVDSGSTKADWYVVDQATDRSILSTKGFNPFFWSSEMIVEELQKDFVHKINCNAVERLVFYGAGCSDVHRCKIIEEALQVIFPQAMIHVEHDLLASARACCMYEAGIACILGTGSNSCLYNGTDITDNVTNLGHMVGDEGSGSYLGKMLIRRYFYREMPEEIEQAFEAAYPMGKKAMLTEIYSVESPNVYLASYSKFLSAHKEHPFVKQLVKKGFNEFISRHVVKYENHENLPVHFVGSIGFHFKEILEQIFEERNLILGTVIKKPIERLVQFHLEHKV